MKKILLVLVVMSITYGMSYSQNVSFDNAIVVLWQGEAEDDYVEVADFNLMDLGELNETTSLYLKSGQALVSKVVSAGGDIVDADMYYRIYKDGEMPGDFINANLPWHSEYVEGELTHQMWWNNIPDEIDLNLLEGITDGVYYIEVYFSAESGDSDIYYLNNDDSNYIAQFTYSSTTILDEIISEKNIEIYPNPASDNINIILSNDANALSVSLLDVNSSIIMQLSDCNSYLNNTITIPTDNLDSGLYFVRLQTIDNVFVKRIIIVK